ncbi:hypothetical protein E4U50_003953 [Claviceps purpurea]|nr:hypothetical protein E4U50_003953 [Claviceps purpurea]
METSSTLQDQCHIFLYTGGEGECEDLNKYKQFGLHPILLGDVLPKPLTCVSDVKKEPRYRIMLKLGYGAFATVWLARDLVEKRYVAVKVGHGSDNSLPDRECEILSQIRKTGPGKHGYERVIELLDAFVVRGPNGFHQCLVTEVVSPLNHPDTRRHCSGSYDVVRQIVEGFAFLHGEGIVHGDPHIGNFGIALPQLEQFEEDDIVEFFGTPEIYPVIPWDPKFPMNSLPPYLVQSVPIEYLLQGKKAFPTGSVTIKILDFGRAYKISEADPNLLGAVPEMIQPPEDALHELCHGSSGSTWSEAADIWAVGCTVWEVREANRNSSKIAQDEERLAFLNLVKRMIITNPDERTPMTALLSDPFMVELFVSLPHWKDGYDYYVAEEKTDIYLIRMFSEDVMDWHVKTWNKFAERFATTLKHPDNGFVSKRSYSSISHQLRRLVFEYFNQDALAEDPLSEEEQSADASEESFDTSVDSSTDSTFDDSQADALDEDTSNASVECSADNADKDSADFDDEKDAADESDYLDGQERAKDPHDKVTTSLVSTESHNKEMNLPEGFAHAKERSVGLVLVELNKEEKKFLSRVLALKGLIPYIPKRRTNYTGFGGSVPT